MRGVFDDREFQEPETRHDTELTLGSTALLLIFFGLALLCGLCFGLGYATGRHGSQETAAALPTAGAQTTPADNARQKPSANAQTSAEAAVSSPAVSTAASPSNQPQVKPAFGNSANPALGALPAASTVGPALAAPGSLMVQIAAVSQQEDADVLMSALRRHGYTVAARREPLDGLIHVRIGPFKSRDEAEKSRQKLLNDGYNAIVQP